MTPVALLVSTTGDPSGAAAIARGAMREIDPEIPFTNVATLRSLIDQTLWAPRTIALLVAAFGGLALLLAAIGLYGVLAYTVSQRTQEIGLRMALGAGPRDIVGMIVGRGLIWTAAGAAMVSPSRSSPRAVSDRSYAASDLRIRLRSSRFRCCSAPSPRSRRTCRRAGPPRLDPSLTLRS